MKIDQRVQEIWSGHESVTDGQTDEWNSYNPLWLRGGGFKIAIGFRWMLCAQFNPNLHHYSILCTVGQLIGVYF